MRCRIGVLLALCFAGLSPGVQAQFLDDITVGYEYLGMNQVNSKEMGRFDIPQVARDYLSVSAARGAFSLGIAYQRTRSETFSLADFRAFLPPELIDMSKEELDLFAISSQSTYGLMVTGGYQRALNDRVRLESFLRFQVHSNSDVSLFQARLSPSYNDLRVNLVFYNPDGNGFLRDRPFYASWYVGASINDLGRFQTVAGSGVWWHHFNLYVTGYYSLNGADNPFSPLPIPDRHRDLSFLQEHGVNVSFSYDWRNFVLNARRNLPINNSGNDLAFSLTYRYFFR